MPDMTYSDSQVSIRQNSWFRGRVETATSKYSNYLLNTPTEDPDYTEKSAYGAQIARTSMQVIDSLMFTLSGDAEVLAAGPAIPDATLQQIVEKTIIKFIPPQVSPAFNAGQPQKVIDYSRKETVQ